MKAVNVQVSDEMHAALKAAAELERRSLSELVRYALQRYLATEFTERNDS